MSHSFTSKLDRAYDHFQHFKRELGVWIESHPYLVVDEPDPEPPVQPITDPQSALRRFRVARVDPVPSRLLLILGDCLFNARSALDHLALTLALKHTPRMTGSEITGSEFPIFGQSALDSKQEKKKIGCVAPAARAAILALQPYHRGGVHFRTHPLWLVHELNRIDKHRELTVCTVCSRSNGGNSVRFRFDSPNSTPTDMTYMHIVGGEMKPNAVLMRYVVTRQTPEPETYVQPAISCEIAFGQSSPAPLQSVIPTVESLLNFVRDSVISPLSKFL